jgi:hypothetical protein
MRTLLLLALGLLVWVSLTGCGKPPPKEQSEIVAARDFLAALDAQDYDRAWSLTADSYREPWAKLIAEARLDSGMRRPVRIPGTGVPAEIEERLTSGEFGEVSPRELFRLARQHVHDEVRMLPPTDSPCVVEIEGDGALVTWKEEYLAVSLRRDADRWLVMYAGSLSDLSSEDPFPGIALPRLRGDRPVPEHEECVTLSVAADGAPASGGRSSTLKTVRDRLTVYDQSYDPRVAANGADHPVRRRVLYLGVHRDAAWSEVEAVLRVATGLEIRYRDVEIVTRVGRRTLHCVALALDGRSVTFPGPRSPLVEVGSTIRDSDLTALRAALGKLREEQIRQGVRARLASDLRSEDALRILLAIAAAGAPQIVVEDAAPTGSSPAGIRIDGETVESQPGPPSPGGEGKLHLTFR